VAGGGGGPTVTGAAGSSSAGVAGSSGRGGSAAGGRGGAGAGVAGAAGGRGGSNVAGAGGRGGANLAGAGGRGGAGVTGAAGTGTGVAGATAGRGGSTVSGVAGSGTGGTPSGTAGSGTGAGGAATVVDLCTGLIQDKAAHPMTALAKPALGQVAVDAEFGTTMRRITSVSSGSIVPMYSTVSAWNADESKLILLNVGGGGHELYDGKTYQFIRKLAINPPDVEQVYWHTTDPDLLMYVDGKSFIRYHVSTSTKDTVTTFSFCSGNANNGSDPMFTSWNSGRLGLRCGDQVFIYDITSNTVLGRKTMSGNPGQIGPSGTFAFFSDSGQVTDTSMNVLRTLDLKEPFGHASLSRLATGEDTWNGQVFDNGPMGNSDIGSLVTFKLTDGTSRVIIGPKTGYPYPPDGHISGMAYRQPGWVFVSTFGKTDGRGLLDLENIIADTSTGKVCRAGRHRSWGKDNTMLGEPYWAEAHTAPSPSGTRAVFASDWGNGSTVDTYVLELPSYKP